MRCKKVENLSPRESGKKEQGREGRKKKDKGCMWGERGAAAVHGTGLQKDT